MTVVVSSQRCRLHREEIFTAGLMMSSGMTKYVVVGRQQCDTEISGGVIKEEIRRQPEELKTQVH